MKNKKYKKLSLRRKILSAAALLTACAMTLALPACAKSYGPPSDEGLFVPDEIVGGEIVGGEAPDGGSSGIVPDGETTAPDGGGTEDGGTEDGEESPPDGEGDPEEDEQPEPEVRTARYILLTASGVNVRTGAGTSYASVGAAEEGTLYAMLGSEGQWYRTNYKNSTAFISAKYSAVLTMEQSSDERIERVIAEGCKLLGVKYVYGATRYHDGTGKLLSGFTATAFDCSSLMQYIFKIGAGIDLQVNTRTQIYQGQTVVKSQIRRGDLLFFTNEARKNNSGIERVGHVALYLGDNYILHTASDYAKIEQISAKRWSYYIQAQRIL